MCTCVYIWTGPLGFLQASPSPSQDLRSPLVNTDPLLPLHSFRFNLHSYLCISCDDDDRSARGDGGGQCMVASMWEVARCCLRVLAVTTHNARLVQQGHDVRLRPGAAHAFGAVGAILLRACIGSLYLSVCTGRRTVNHTLLLGLLFLVHAAAIGPSFPASPPPPI